LANVDAVTMFVMDLDNVSPANVDAVADNLASMGVRAFAWTTWGSGWKKLPESWRVVVPFAVDVDAADWPSVWLILSERLALGHNDPGTKDASRMHFLPRAPLMVPDGKGGKRQNNAVQWWTVDGHRLFDPSSVVAEARKLVPLAPTVPTPHAKRPDDVVGAARTRLWGTARLAGICRDLATTPDGGKHHALYAAAMSAKRGVPHGHSEDEATRALVDVVDGWGKRVASPHLARQTIAKGLANGTEPPAYPEDRPMPSTTAPKPDKRASGGEGTGGAFQDSPLPMVPLKDGTPDRVIGAVRGARTKETWRSLPDPMPLAPIPRAPTFPIDVLPQAVADFCADQARALGVAVEMVAVPVLVALAGAIGRGVHLRLREGFDVRACLWGMIVSPPGRTKTPALKAATKPLVDAEGVRAVPMREARTKWLARKKEADAVEKGYLRSVADASAKGTAPPDRPSEADPPPEPPTDHIVVNDVTVEKLADLMATSRGLTLVADELAAWLHSFKKYRGDGGSDAPFYLTAYSGGTHKVQRLSREDRIVDDAYLNVLGGIQPAKAQSLLKVGDDGLFERFGLIAYPDDVPGTWTAPTDANPTVRDRFERMIGDLLAKEWGPVASSAMLRRPKVPSQKTAPTDSRRPVAVRADGEVDIMGNNFGEGWGPDVEPATVAAPVEETDDATQDLWVALGGPLTVNLTPGARTVWRGYEARLGYATGTHVVADLEPFMGKALDLVGRFALVLHLAQWAADGAVDVVGDVSQSTMESAVRLIDEYCVASWLRTIALVTSTAEQNNAVKVDEKLKELRWVAFSPRDMAKKGWRGLKSAKECTVALKELVDHGRVLPPEGETVSERMGRPPKTYRVNPKLLAEWWAP